MRVWGLCKICATELLHFSILHYSKIDIWILRIKETNKKIFQHITSCNTELNVDILKLFLQDVWEKLDNLYKDVNPDRGKYYPIF